MGSFEKASPRHRWRLAHARFIAAGALLLSLTSAAVGRGATCPTTFVSTDTSTADTTLLVYFGRAYGQVFLATDTVLQGITVYRPAVDVADYDQVKLYILGVDNNGTPVTSNIILDGPAFEGPLGDGVHPVPVRFTLNPPVTLPRLGLYCFAVKENFCDGAFHLIGGRKNAYPYGMAWEFEKGFACVGLSLASNANPNLDLAFEVDFCDMATPASRTTWGELKLRYR